MIKFFKKSHNFSKINTRIYYLFWTDLSLLDSMLLLIFEYISRKFIFTVIPLTLITLGESASTKLIINKKLNIYNFFNFRYGAVLTIFLLSSTLLCVSFYFFVLTCLINLFLFYYL